MTRAGITCQHWSHQWPNEHVKTHTNFPNSGLGGHNHCRNPDGMERPWCYTVDTDLRWDYCIVPPAAAQCSEAPPKQTPPNVTEIILGRQYRGEAKEHEMMFYHVPVPQNIAKLKAVVVPFSGDPDMFISFDNAQPTPANFTFIQERGIA